MIISKRKSKHKASRINLFFFGAAFNWVHLLRAYNDLFSMGLNYFGKVHIHERLRITMVHFAVILAITLTES